MNLGFLFKGENSRMVTGELGCKCYCVNGGEAGSIQIHTMLRYKTNFFFFYWFAYLLSGPFICEKDCFSFSKTFHT